MLLADLGAEVIKIENPAEGGDVSRSVGPHFFPDGDSHFYQSLNRNKKSLTLNLKHPQAQAVLRRLVRTADATYDNLRGDQPEKFGVTYAQLQEFNPKIVCAHLSAYGREGPRKSWPGYDYLMQAEAGYLALTGEPDGPPSRMGLSIVDLMTGRDRWPRAGVRRSLRARHGGGARHRRVPVRHRPAEPGLSRGVVPQRRRQPGPRAALEPPLAHPQPALSHERRLHLHHVQQGEVLARAVPLHRPAGVGHAPRLHRTSRRALPTARS